MGPNPKTFVHIGLMKKKEIALNNSGNAGNGMESMHYDLTY